MEFFKNNEPILDSIEKFENNFEIGSNTLKAILLLWRFFESQLFGGNGQVAGSKLHGENMPAGIHLSDIASPGEVGLNDGG